MFGNNNQSGSDSKTEDAVFIGWQPGYEGEAFPLFTVTVSGHTLCGSTVSETTLRALNMEIPQIPPFKRRG